MKRLVHDIGYHPRDPVSVCCRLVLVLLLRFLVSGASAQEPETFAAKQPTADMSSTAGSAVGPDVIDFDDPEFTSSPEDPGLIEKLPPMFDASGHRLINEEVLSSVLVRVLVTAILGPVLTEAFSRKLQKPPP
jgi:hypothetical protein